ALTSSPTRLAASAPASTAARTLPTSPRTSVVTNPPPTCTRPPRWTFAALSIASVASITPTSPLVSINPSASPELLGRKLVVRETDFSRVAIVSNSVVLGGCGGSGRGGRGLREGENSAQILVGPGDNLDADDLADPAGRRGARVDSRLDRGHVAGHEGRHQAAADLVPADQLHVGRLEHCVAGFHKRDKAFGLDHSERFNCC